jgi:hypothetical protein
MFRQCGHLINLSLGLRKGKSWARGTHPKLHLQVSALVPPESSRSESLKPVSALPSPTLANAD